MKRPRYVCTYFFFYGCPNKIEHQSGAVYSTDLRLLPLNKNSQFFFTTFTLRIFAKNSTRYMPYLKALLIWSPIMRM